MRIQEKDKKEEMWKKISEFSLDNPTSSFTLSKRLAKENGWAYNYAQRVIQEYKKFLYLAVVSGKSLTPSEEVDQAWHLHMIYTHSYWKDLCKDTLGMEFHHGPTKGGKQETTKYTDQYQFTLDLYKQEFGHDAPADIWPDTKSRFENIHFLRVNTNENIVLNKAKVKQHLMAYSLAFVAFLCVTILMSASGEGETDFLSFVLYFCAGLLAFFVIHGIVRYCTRENRVDNDYMNNYNEYKKKKSSDTTTSYYSSKSSSKSSSSSSKTDSKKTEEKSSSNSNSSSTDSGAGCTIASSFLGCHSSSDSGHGHSHGCHSDSGSSDGGSSDGGSGCGSSGCSGGGCGGGGCGGGCGS